MRTNYINFTQQLHAYMVTLTPILRIILLNYPMLSHSFVVVNPHLITQSALADL